MSDQPFKLRWGRVTLDPGEIEVPLTSRQDQSLCFQELYHLRWEIEDARERRKIRFSLVQYFPSKRIFKPDYFASADAIRGSL